MPSIVQPVVTTSMDLILKSIEQSRWSMSLEMLYVLQDQLHLASSMVQETMNSLLPINRLPSEILSLIFGMIMEPLSPAGFDGPFASKKTVDLIPVTHVCRRWRVVALGTPSLWSTLYEDSVSLAPIELLQVRAQDTPLTVYINRSHPTCALVRLLSVPRVGLHVKQVFLQGCTLSQLSTELIGFSAPNLEYAVVRRRAPQTRALEEDGNSIAGAPIKRIVGLFGGVTPKLKLLFLHDIPFLPSNKFEQLVDLRLSYETSSVHYTLDDLLQLLSRCPILETMTFVGLPSDFPSVSSSSLPHVSLPCLRKLSISDSRGQAIFMREILAYLDLPADCAIRLYGLTAHLLSPSFEDLHLPCVEPPATLSIDVSFVSVTLTLASPRAGGSISLELETTGATKAILQRCIKLFVARFSTSIDTVTISSQRNWATWCDPDSLLLILPNTTSLAVDDLHLVDQCLDALWSCDGVGADTAPDSYLCPHLALLRLPQSLTNPLLQKLHSVMSEREHRGTQMQWTKNGL